MFNEILFNSLINGYDNHLMSRRNNNIGGGVKTIYILNLRSINADVAAELPACYPHRTSCESCQPRSHSPSVSISFISSFASYLFRLCPHRTRAKYVRLRRIHFNLIKFWTFSRKSCSFGSVAMASLHRFSRFSCQCSLICAGWIGWAMVGSVGLVWSGLAWFGLVRLRLGPFWSSGLDLLLSRKSWCHLHAQLLSACIYLTECECVCELYLWVC